MKIKEFTLVLKIKIEKKVGKVIEDSLFININ